MSLVPRVSHQELCTKCKVNMGSEICHVQKVPHWHRLNSTKINTSVDNLFLLFTMWKFAATRNRNRDTYRAKIIKDCYYLKFRTCCSEGRVRSLFKAFKCHLQSFFQIFDYNCFCCLWLPFLYFCCLMCICVLNTVVLTFLNPMQMSVCVCVCVVDLCPINIYAHLSLDLQRKKTK